MIHPQVPAARIPVSLIGHEAQAFNQVSKAELDVAMEFTREVLKSLYQYSTLLQKIRDLKAP